MERDVEAGAAMTTRDAARLLGVTAQTVRNWARLSPRLVVARDPAGAALIGEEALLAHVRSCPRLVRLVGSRKPAVRGGGPRKALRLRAPAPVVEAFWSEVRARGIPPARLLALSLDALRAAPAGRTGPG